MPGETVQARKARARRIVRGLLHAHPDAHCALHHRSAFQLLCATILSAQCTDKKVNAITPRLFERYPDARALAAARPAELESIIRPTGFFRSKAKSLRTMSAALVADHGGKVPRTMEELVDLPGVGRKTANVILGNAFDTPGIVVDTHVARVTRRLGLTTATDPVRIELDLMELVPKARWTQFSHATIFHGRRICAARKPLCEGCPVVSDCCWAADNMLVTKSSRPKRS